ncbi:polyketide-type polyunsaturated fatty acid synthase PfaA [Pedobacter steynii]|uniref:Polyketide-type polyunsaturated fatty acid synthase PfaA n=1 Tax=Pedobacter steynii TaxID=430522 RepID=A0A1G9ZG16_9SPHI|nr:type I polyketide synthase [Pedobacter steynii]NQX40044.1 type I polyketide synthase [Pedobacter steynii]SDN19931.1 polyketide-type polyunsaturated fatty acid synthase PfaA [Pedobacter steynii]
MKTPLIIGITPFERPDVNLALSLSNAKAFPVLHLGRDRIRAAEALEQLTEKSSMEFGVCLVSEELNDIILPEQVTMVILPYGMKRTRSKKVKLFYQVHDVHEAQKAQAEGADGLIVKGNEGAGKVGYESSYVLFQRIAKEIKDIDLYVQGGVGIHTAAALIAFGAKGVVLDSQLALFPESTVPKAIKQVCEKLSGNETRLIGDFRVLVRPNSPSLDNDASAKDLENYFGDFDLEKAFLPMGQDIALAIDLEARYRKLAKLVFGIEEAVYGHLNQAKSLNVISAGNALSKELNITYPIAQGPMTRVSDVAPFANAVAEAGALPFIALSLLKGETAKNLIIETKRLAGDKTWGVGILGFAPQELRDEQIEYIKEQMPPVVLIAGGRPSQAKPLEKLGIKTFLHVPSVSLLDMFLKEGAKRFVFEGRECGGHVGPLSSMVLWEKQIERLLKEDHPEQISVFFAGGIHDSLSAAFIAVMAAPLAAKGVKVGVLMGTSYLYTKEAVSTGAIQEQFQEQARLSNDTILLETAPGHETRCLNSPFATFFNQEKEKLQKEGIDKKEIWAKLETLNVGRLRIAAKGIERRGDQLVTIDEQEQLNLGMYMIGQIASMCNEIVSILDLHKEVADGNFQHIQQAVLSGPPEAKEKSLNVAIVGMACIFPGAKNIEEYWRNIILGTDAVTEVPDERWNKALYYDPASTAADMSHSKWGGFIPKIDFDPLEYGIPPQSLAAIEPTQLLSLMVAKQAMEHAGYKDGSFNAENVSVIIGAEGGNDLANSYSFRCFFKQVFGEMPEELDAALPKMTEDSFPGILANVISGRITNRLNLGGRNFTVDAACASSLAAIDLACQELFLEKSDMVLAGGADLHNGINDYLMFSSTHALSRKGRCATFDAEADGIALGEGVAMLVLKRHEDALRDGDTVYAVIQGIGGSSDGKSLGLTAPRKSGQVKALERAYEQAGISPALLGLVEAHGTGTVVGDRTELTALTDMLNQSGAIANQTHLGSVKTQIGHTKCAAGLAGLIKATLSAYYGIKPPTIHLKTPNSYYNGRTSPFAFHTEAALWLEEKRYAGVSAFGFGGTNFHAVIESNHQVSDLIPAMKSWPSELFVFRGNTYEAAKARLTKVKNLLDENDNIDLKDIAYSLAVENDQPVQLSIVADRPEDLLMKIDLALSGIESKDTYITRKKDGKVAFMFPGQGSQRINMARDLFVIFPVMRKLLKGKPEYEKVLFPNAVFDEDSSKAQKDRIKDTRMAQPLLGIVDLALANFLKELGMVPDMVAGHSYGELPALCFAGAFEEDQLVFLSEQRAQSILDAVVGEDTGAMIAVNGRQEELSKWITGVADVYAVNFNSPTQQVLAGTTPAIKKLSETLKAAKVSFRPLEVACAFHSPIVAKSKENYQTVLSQVSFNDLSLPVWSNTTAKTYPVNAEAVKERLTDHLVQPVQFVEQVQQMYADGARIFVEVGPGKVLTSLVKACLAKDELLLYAEDNGHNKITHLLCTLASYMATGRALKVEKLFDGREGKLLNLDEPGQYKKSPTVWSVNGQHAVPAVGKLPAYGALPIIEPIKMKNIEGRTEIINAPSNAPSNAAELMMQEYLNSMKMMIQAQRDVMLTFLGQAIPQGTPQAFQPLQSAAVAQHVIPATVVAAVQPVVAKQAKIQIDVKMVLMQIVSDKTGYPQEMLGMEMDLEADLSIDSIKRMEIIGALRTELGGFSQADKNEDTFMEQLAAIKTLNGLVNWIKENSQVTENIAEAEQTLVSPVSTTVKFTAADIKSAILLVVSEKTGYPQDMLGMDLDLEADLSIDSIKRMEIIGELKVKIGFSKAEDAGDDLMEKLAAIKTLNGLVNWISEIETEGLETVTAAQKIIDESAENSGERLSRLRFELTPSELLNTEFTPLKGQRFAVTDDEGPQSIAIKRAFEKQGALVDIVAVNGNLKGYQGLVILNMFASPNQTEIIDNIALIKQLDLEEIKWVYVISDTKGHMTEQADATLLRRFQGYSGLFKSLDKEYENTKFRVISLATKQTAKHIAEITLNEILNPDEPSEVIYNGEGRQTLELIPSELITGLGDSHIQLDRDAVVLVLGGAQGITSELMMRFAKDYPCRYILVGRSSDPRTNGLEQFSFLKTKEEIRAYLIQLGNLKKPAEIELETSKIYKNNQILQTISSMEITGSTVSYEALDLRDEQGLSALISNVYQEYERIDGVVHGAGLLEDKLFHAKSLDSFKRVFETKVTPLRVLAEQLRADTQFVILFSSIASVYGNRGQTDYAAANSVMDRYAWALKEKIKGKVMSINWGPWKGAGMVSPSLEKEYERRGISMIPLDEGMETFLNEMKYGNESQVLIMAGNNW